MQIHKGTTRTVITFPSLGIVVKFAHIKLGRVLKNILYNLRRGRRASWKHFFERKVFYSYNTIWYHLLCGICSNHFEWKYTLKSNRSFITPTYFSLGIVSVMKYVHPLPKELNGLEFGKRTAGIVQVLISEDTYFKDAHHLCIGRNFGLLHGRLVICDYGGPRTQAILREYGDRLDSLDLVKQLNLDKPPRR